MERQMPRMWVISPVGFTGSLKGNFLEGFGSNDQNDYEIKDDIGYDQDALRGVVNDFNNSGVEFLVTVGGLLAATAALEVSEYPFISLVGGRTANFPGILNGNFFGGINLNSFNLNYPRIQHLVDKNKIKDLSEVCLLLASNSAMSEIEQSLWPKAAGRTYIVDAEDADSMQTTFEDFRERDDLTAMIVSADPFFQENRNDLIKAANQVANDDVKKHISYPFHIFKSSDAGGHKSGKAKPNPKHHTIYGPKLATEYYNLGKKAASILGSKGRKLMRSTFDLANVPPPEDPT
jgi:hypothetical protein